MNIPSNISQPISVMKAYTKTQLACPVISGRTVTPNQTTIIKFPASKIVDKKTFKLVFQAYTNGTTTHPVGFPRFMSSLIQSLEVKINGKRIQFLNNYNRIYNTLINYSPEYTKIASKLHNNADPSCQYFIADDGALTKEIVHYLDGSSDAIASFKKIYCIDDFLGFLNTEKSFFNTNSVGDVELIFTWASANVLWRRDATPASPTYNIVNIQAFIDGIDFRDESYLQKYQSKIENGGDKFVFKHYEIFHGDTTTNSKVCTMRITESTNSLDKVLFTYLDKDRETITTLQLGDTITPVGTTSAGLLQGGISSNLYTYDTLVSVKNPSILNTSRYFRQNGLGMGAITEGGAEITLKIDGQDEYTGLNFINAYAETLKTFNLNYDNINCANPAIKSLTSYEKDFYLVAFSTEHIGGVNNKEVSLISGINTDATAINLEIQVKNPEKGAHANQTALPVIITETTKVLTIGSGRQIAIED